QHLKRRVPWLRYDAEFAASGDRAGGIQQPDVEARTAGAPPENVRHSITVEVGEPEHDEIGTQVRERRGAGLRRSIHEPDDAVAGALPPEDVGLAVAIKVGATRNREVGSDRSQQEAGWRAVVH